MTGFFSVTIESTSYLHISSSQYTTLLKEENIIELLKKQGFTEEAIHSVAFEDRYLGFHMTAGLPSIPASSAKGNIRSRIELSFKAKEGKVRSCFIRATRPLPPSAVDMRGWRHHRIWGDVVLENRDQACDFTVNRQVCLVCDLFGTNGLQGLIRFSDFVGDGVRLERLGLEYGMSVLAATPNSRFKGSIDFLNLKPEEMGLLFIGMGLRNSARGKDVLLGRFKYRGQMKKYKLGRVVYQLEKLRVSEFSKPIEIDGISLKPGQTLEGEALSNLVNILVANSIHYYEGELDIKDEVLAVEKL
ncbi:MAG: RAMP superfamily CRISPR-associated protein [Thermoproteota archaeon]